jgi:hypothetical protein
MLLLAILALATTLVELWLVEHTKEPLQFLPIVLCVAGIAALLAALFRPRKITLMALRATMLIVGLGGVLGVGIHLLRNFSFEQEVRPNAQALDLFMRAIKGAAPLLAPGALVFAALLAISATYRHPALENE